MRTSQNPPTRATTHRAAGHGQLDQEELVEGALGVVERLGHDQQVAVGQRRGPDPERRAAGLVDGASK